MIGKRVLKTVICLMLSVVMAFSAVVYIPIANKVSAASESQTSTEPSLIDSVLNLVCEKGAGIVKDKLPAVGDYLCSKVFDYMGIDYRDSYTKNIEEVNNKLKTIEAQLQDVLRNMEKQESVNTMKSFYNNVDVLSNVVYSIYIGYSSLVIKQATGQYTDAEVAAAEEDVYNELKKRIFGSGTSTGDLYLQLKSLCDMVLVPNTAKRNMTLMEHYTITYEYLWAFDIQSFTPKKEFLGYVSATLLQGVALYTFQKLYELKTASETQAIIIAAEWSNIAPSIKNAFEYLKKEIDNISATEKERNDSNTVFHYASGKILSKTLYSGKIGAGKDKHFGYASSYNTTRQGNIRSVSYYVLNNSNFVDLIQNDFKKYVSNYKKDSSFTILDFLKTVGFTCDNWDCIGIYKNQSYKHEGTFITCEYWRFYVNYANLNGNSVNEQWVRLRQNVLGDPGSEYTERLRKANYIGFVGTDGVLIGSFGKPIYDDIGNLIVDNIYRMLTGGYYDWKASEKGKVR